MPLSRIAVAAALMLALPQAGVAFTFSSKMPAFLVTEASEISANPAAAQDWNECYPANDDFSAPGQILADGGWVVTSEVEFHEFELVSFAALASPKGEGGCEYQDGKIAVWHQGAFVALIEEAVADRFLIGHIAPVDGSVVEIRTGASLSETSGYIAFDAATEELFISPAR